MDRSTGPRLKIKRAYEHITNLSTAQQEFIATNPYTRYTEDDPHWGDLVYKISVEPHAAEGLRNLSLIAGDAIHNLRSALDLLAWQLVEANNGKPGDATQFPIWRTQAQFLGGGPGRMRGAHPDAIQTVRSLKPYKGGNASLWRLNRLDATDKHRLLLTVGAIPESTTLHFTLFGEPRSQVLPAHLTGKPPVLLEDGAEVHRISAADREYFESQPDPEFSLFIALREVEAPYGLPMVTTLRDLATTTTEIIDLLSPFLAD